MTVVRYDVVAGDYMAKIAAAHGTTIGRIWNHPDNATHRARRGSPDVLYAGDVLWIPDQPAPAPPSAHPDQPPGPVDETGARWPYPRARGPHPASTSPAWCSHVQCQCHPPTNHDETTSRTIVFYDHQGQRLAKARCRVWYNGRLLNLERPYADAEGKLSFEGPDGGADVLLEWAPEHTPLGRPYPYRLRYHLDVGGPNGLRRRLHNLGFSRLPTLEENVRAFQAAYCLDVTGRPEDIEERLLRDYDVLGLKPVPSRDASTVEPSWLKDHKTALERLSPVAGRSALRAKAEAKTGATKASSGGATTGAGTTTPAAKSRISPFGCAFRTPRAIPSTGHGSQ